MNGQKLINYFLKHDHLNEDEKSVLLETMNIKKLDAGSYLVNEGDFNNESFFVLDGLVRQYKIIDGNEITTNFFTEEQWIISLEGLEATKASDHYLICVEDTTIVTGDESKAQQLFEKFPRFESISRKIMEAVFMEQQAWMSLFMTSKPEDRYLNLLKTRPEIFQRVPQYDIATYIGVKPESLSRIRKKIQLKSSNKQ